MLTERERIPTFRALYISEEILHIVRLHPTQSLTENKINQNKIGDFYKNSKILNFIVGKRLK